MRKILSWNVNGLRAVCRNGFYEWMERQAADIFCLQEIKCHPSQLELTDLSPLGLNSYWACAQKPGYSGVAIYTKSKPLKVEEGIGLPQFDNEGRVLIAYYSDFVLINAYFPNSQRDHSRLVFKLEFCKAMLHKCQKLRQAGYNLILCGDINIAPEEIDLANPQSNKNNAGFLPEERAWFSEFLLAGYVDMFRYFHPNESGHYTWWSYRPGVRSRNIGWRIDHFCVNQEWVTNINDAFILPDVYGSDHCPIGIEIK